MLLGCRVIGIRYNDRLQCRDIADRIDDINQYNNTTVNDNFDDHQHDLNDNHDHDHNAAP